MSKLKSDKKRNSPGVKHFLQKPAKVPSQSTITTFQFLMMGNFFRENKIKIIPLLKRRILAVILSLSKRKISAGYVWEKKKCRLTSKLFQRMNLYFIPKTQMYARGVNQLVLTLRYIILYSDWFAEQNGFQQSIYRRQKIWRTERCGWGID